MVKDHTDSERGKPLPPPYGLLLPISSKRSFNIHHPIERTERDVALW